MISWLQANIVVVLEDLSSSSGTKVATVWVVFLVSYGDKLVNAI
jgi:hypothetical protein